MHNRPTARTRFSTAALLAAGVTLGASAFAPAAQAQVVTTLDDNGAGSLRSVLAGANAGDTITFADGLDGTLQLDSELTVDKAITIDGSGRSITINGRNDENNSNRIFTVNAPGNGDEVTLRGLTLQNGRVEGGAGGDGVNLGGGGGGGVGAGGAIYGQSGVIVLDGTTIRNSNAKGGDGGNGGVENTSEPSTAGAGGDGSGAFSGGGGGVGGTPDGENGDFGSGGGGGVGASDATNRGAGGDGAGEAGGGSPGKAVQGGGGGGGSGLGGGVFLDRGATLVLAGDGQRFDGNSVTVGEGGLPPENDGADDGQDGGARGPSFAARGSTDVRLQVADGDRLAVDTDGFASIDNIGSGSSTAPPLNEDLNFTKTGPGSVTLFSSGSFDPNPEGVVAGDSSYDLTVNEGSFNPGGFDNTGTTVVSGDYVQGDDGVLDIEFDEDSIDLVQVEGDASLNGDVNFIETGDGVDVDTTRTFLQLTGGGTLSGDFDAVRTTLLTDTRILGADVSYRADGADVTFNAIDFLADFTGDDPLENRETVGEFLNNVASGDRGDAGTRRALRPAFDALLGADDLDRAVLSQANTTASAALAAVPDNLLLAPYIALARLDQGASGFTDRRERLASRNATRMLAQAAPDRSLIEAPVVVETVPVVVDPVADPVVVTDTVPADPAYATLPEDAGAFAPLDGGPALFAQAIGAFSDVDGDNAAPGQDSRTYGVAFGGDWALEDWNAVLGVFVAYSETETGVDTLGDEFDNDAFQVGLYGAKRFDEHLVLNGTASAAFLNFNSTRPTPLGDADGDADGFAVGATLEALYDLPAGDHFIVSPLVGVEAYFVDRDSYDEDGAGALNLSVDDSSAEYLTSVIGVQVATAVELEALGNLRLSPMVRLGWSHQFMDQEGSTTSAFAVAPGESFTTRSTERDRDALRVAAAFEVGPGDSDDWAVFARYTGDIAGNGDSHAVRAGLRLSF